MNNSNTTIYVRVKGPRPANFVDPVPFEWNQEKEDFLWSQISNLNGQEQKGSINWQALSQQLKVPVKFLLKCSFKLYSKHIKILEQYVSKDKNELPLSMKIEETMNLADLALVLGAAERQQHRLMMEQERALNTANPLIQGTDVSEITFQQSLPIVNKSGGLMIQGHASEAEEDKKLNRYEDETLDAMQKLQTSKILSFKRPLANHASNRAGTTDNEGNDTISSLSVSNSALEEALLDRLHL